MDQSPNSKHGIFINEVAKHGDRILAYKTAYPHVTNSRVASTNATRLLKKADIALAVETQKKKLQDLANLATAQQLASTAVAETLTFVRKREILAQIVKGDYLLPKIIPVREVIETRTKNGVKREFITSMKKVMAPPDHADVLKAMDIDSRLTGDYAAEKREVSLLPGGDGVTQERLPDIQFNTFIQILNNG